MPRMRSVFPVLRDHKTRVAGVDAAAERDLGGLRHVDGHDRRDGGHHLARLLLVEVEDAREHPRLAGVDLALMRALGDQQLEILGGADLLELRPRVDPEQPQHGVRCRVQQLDQRVESGAEPLSGRATRRAVPSACTIA